MMFSNTLNCEEGCVPGLLSSGLLLALMIYVFYVPVHWRRGLNDFDVSRSSKSRSSRKCQKYPSPYPNGWFAVAESKEIKPGSVKSISCLGESFAVFRSSKSNEVFILDAFCPHMGANLGVGGIVRQDCIECPFHQWKFSGKDGKCVEIPYSSGLTEIEKSARLKKWPALEQNGLIFVWYHAENEAPWDLPAVDSVDTGHWKFHGHNEFLVKCHIQDIPENGADIAHLMSVHGPSFVAGSDIRFTRSRWFSIGNHIWDAKWSVDENDKHSTTIILTHVVKIWKFELMKVTARIKQLGPGYVIMILESSFGQMAILQSVTPVEPLLQKMCHYFYGPRYLAWFIKFTIIAETINVSRDVMIWNYKKFIANPLLPKEDKLIKQFRIWFNQFYSENSVSYVDATSDLSW